LQVAPKNDAHFCEFLDDLKAVLGIKKPLFSPHKIGERASRLNSPPSMRLEVRCPLLMRCPFAGPHCPSRTISAAPRAPAAMGFPAADMSQNT